MDMEKSVIGKDEFRDKGYLYDSMENYSDLINFDEYKNWVDSLMSHNLIRNSIREYWFSHNSQSYQEYIHYKDLLKVDDSLEDADYVFQKGHEYQLKKIEESGFKPSWIFGKADTSEINHILFGETIMNFQKKFVERYYPDKVSDEYESNFAVQYYDKGCLIDTHDDGRPEGRICVFLYFLNDGWNQLDGGNLIVDVDKLKSTMCTPSYPKFIVLDSDVNLVHEVQKVQKNVRYTAVNFLANK